MYADRGSSASAVIIFIVSKTEIRDKISLKGAIKQSSAPEEKQ